MTFPDDMINEVCIGDCLEILKAIPDGSVHAVVTSPPYWALRNYGDADGQIGLESSPEEYTAALFAVFREVYRVLRHDGTLWLNLGDTYSNQKGRSGAYDPARQAHRYAESQSINVAATTLGGVGVTTPSNRSHPTLKPKDLIGIPWRVAFALQGHAVIGCRILAHWRSMISQAMFESDDAMRTDLLEDLERDIQRFDFMNSLMRDGWILRQDVIREIDDPDLWTLEQDHIWNKPNPMPESVGDRCTKAHEYLFMFAKSRHYYFDSDAIREPHQDQNGLDRFVDGCGVGKRNDSQGWHGGKVSLDHDRAYNSMGRNKRSVWTITPEPYPRAHFAVFPTELVRPCIQAGTSERGVCPECGAPWYRMVRKSKSFESGSGRSGNPIDGKHGPDLQGGGDTGDIRKGPVIQTDTIGWRPDCMCGDWTCENQAPVPVPAIVLDPFGGTGTTAWTAQNLGRHFIHIDLGYKELAVERLSQRGLL